MIFDTLTFFLIIPAAAYFAYKRLLTYLHALQQDDYDNDRFLKWIVEKRVFDKRLSAALLFPAALSFVTPSITPAALLNILVMACFGFAAYTEKDPRKDSKKALVMTARAKRIFYLALGGLILLCASTPSSLSVYGPWLSIFYVQLVPFTLIVSNMALEPYENHIQKTYWTQAHRKVEKLQPQIIGVTGSFGKTSVKHILGHILKTQAPTLITPGSVNTPMGITRIIRERLEDRHRYFIVEMGAYGPGSVKRLCALTPPDMGIITSVGHAHYERFKSLDTVAQTKFELADSVIAKSGNVIVHEQALRFPAPQSLLERHKDRFIICGEDAEKSALLIRDIRQSTAGLEVDITHTDGTAHMLALPLYGLHHAHNAVLAFAAAAALGVDPENIKTALKSLPQIEHRLEVKRQPDGTILIDDAFNSNPQGFKAALDLLAVLGEGGGRKILITPGMVELGKAHDKAHKAAGQQAGKICDIALVVQAARIPAFVEGFKATGGEKTLIGVENFAAAHSWFNKRKQAGDVLLIENDLPDLYERVPKL